MLKISILLVAIFATIVSAKFVMNRGQQFPISQTINGKILYIGYYNGYSVALSSYDLATGTETELYNFGTEWESFFVECSTTNDNIYWFSLETIANASIGSLIAFDVVKSEVLYMINHTLYCEEIFYDADYSNQMFCLHELVSNTVCLSTISLNDGTTKTVGCFPESEIPTNMVNTYDRTNKIVYTQLGSLNTIDDLIFAMDVTTGKVTSQSQLSVQNILYNMEWDQQTGNFYGYISVVENNGWATFFAEIDPTSPTFSYTQVGALLPAQYQQINSITCLAEPLRTFYVTMFTYVNKQPYLWLVGVALNNGTITSADQVTNPFIDIEYMVY